MKRKTRTILEELNSLYSEKNKSAIIESRAIHIIDSAINLINTMYENYEHDTASELERRLINSIRGQDNKKFIRSILAKRIRMRSVPDLHFFEDKSIVEGMRISNLVSQTIAKDESKRDKDDPQEQE